ncbi:MAG: helix-turn-helix domain-containing protein [Alphaproteobacteria bacterium]|nr:helix-turn-helix domain-containing protein [Alphaproteobacteria bacterium]
MKPRYTPSVATARALRTLGNNLRTARLRRRLQTATVAERAFLSRETLRKIERGDPGVSMGNYAAVMLALGALDGLSAIADPGTDAVGLRLEEERLPRRIRYTRSEEGGAPRRR